jgi:hypothetical protein
VWCPLDTREMGVVLGWLPGAGDAVCPDPVVTEGPLAGGGLPICGPFGPGIVGVAGGAAVIVSGTTGEPGLLVGAGVVLPEGVDSATFPPHVLATQTGAFAFTGTFAVLLAPVGDCVAFPPVQLLATHTGAFPFTGALAAAAASTTALPT